MLKCIENGVKHFGIDLPESVNMATLYPAQLAKLNKGKIEAGYDADLTFFNDKFTLKGTYMAGKQIN